MVGVWMAYYSDYSAIVLFDPSDELGALRHAVENNMSVTFIRFGTPIREQT